MLLVLRLALVFLWELLLKINKNQKESIQVKFVNVTKTSKSFPTLEFVLKVVLTNLLTLLYLMVNDEAARVITVLSSSLASSSSGSVVTEGVLGLYQEICRTRPLNFAPWLAAYNTKQR